MRSTIFIGLLLVFMSLAACGGKDGGREDASRGSGSKPVNQAGLGALQPVYLDDVHCPAPRCFEVAVPLPQEVKVPENRLRVVLPENYFDSQQSGRSYPVLYLLHGVADNFKSWTEMTDLVHLTRGLDLIVVMPDGGGSPEPGWYSDWVDGSRQWESFHIGVMIPYIEEHLRIAGEGHRAVAGISMGGFGAFSYAARHPELFAAAASISGILDTLPSEQLGGAVFWLGAPLLSTPATEVWGDPIAGYAEWQAHNPRSLLDKLAGTALFMTTGNGLPGGEHDDPAKVQEYSTELAVNATAVQFRIAADDAGLDYQAFFYGPGFHDWEYFKEGLRWVLPQIMAEIRP